MLRTKFQNRALEH